MMKLLTTIAGIILVLLTAAFLVGPIAAEDSGHREGNTLELQSYGDNGRIGTNPDGICEQDDFLRTRPLDYVWISLIMATSVFYYTRKVVIRCYGGECFWIGWGLGFKDWKQIKTIIDNEASPGRRFLLRALNRSVSVTFIVGMVIMILSRWDFWTRLGALPAIGLVGKLESFFV